MVKQQKKHNRKKRFSKGFKGNSAEHFYKCSLFIRYITKRFSSIFMQDSGHN